jgi:glycosyltransferase involved in cell wall biosynthesis
MLAVMQLPASGEGSLARINLIYVGPLDDAHGVDAMADAFLAAHTHDPRLHLLLAGDGPQASDLRDRLGRSATFVQADCATAVEQRVADADLLICPTTAADAAPAIEAAQLSGLPVLAVDGGAAAALIENGRSGFLVPDDQVAFVDAIRWLSRRATLRERLAVGGRVAAEARKTSGDGRIMGV